MPFMFLTLAFLLGAVLWGFFHSNPRGVSPARVLVCTIAILALAAAAAVASALPLYGDAFAKHPESRFMAVYLAVMAGGAAFMIVVALGGLARNLVLFPLSRRSGTTP